MRRYSLLLKAGTLTTRRNLPKIYYDLKPVTPVNTGKRDMA